VKDGDLIVEVLAVRVGFATPSASVAGRRTGVPSVLRVWQADRSPHSPSPMTKTSAFPPVLHLAFGARSPSASDSPGAVPRHLPSVTSRCTVTRSAPSVRVWIGSLSL